MSSNDFLLVFPKHITPFLRRRRLLKPHLTFVCKQIPVLASTVDILPQIHLFYHGERFSGPPQDRLNRKVFDRHTTNPRCPARTY